MLKAAASNAAAVAQVDNVSLPALPTRASTARQAASNRAGPAQTKALAAPDLAVLQHAAKQLTDYQQAVLVWLGLVTLGPADTIDDGECIYRAVSQQLRMWMPAHGTLWALQPSEQAQDTFEGLRKEAAQEILRNKWLRQRLVSQADFLINKSSAHSQRSQVLKRDMKGKAPSELPRVLAARVQKTIAKGMP